MPKHQTQEATLTVINVGETYGFAELFVKGERECAYIPMTVLKRFDVKVGDVFAGRVFLSDRQHDDRTKYVVARLGERVKLPVQAEKADIVAFLRTGGPYETAEIAEQLNMSVHIVKAAANVAWGEGLLYRIPVQPKGGTSHPVATYWMDADDDPMEMFGDD